MWPNWNSVVSNPLLLYFERSVTRPWPKLTLRTWRRTFHYDIPTEGQDSCIKICAMKLVIFSLISENVDPLVIVFVLVTSEDQFVQKTG